jgi:hypothetical protein
MPSTLRNALLVLLAAAAAAVALRRCMQDEPPAPPANGPAAPAQQPGDPRGAPAADPAGRQALATGPGRPLATGRNTGAVRVLVRSFAGEPVPRCRVALGGGIEAFTGADGAAAFELPPQRLWLDVEPPAGVDLCAYRSRVTFDRGIQKDVLVVLDGRAQTLWCRLVAAENGQLLTAASVAVYPRDRQPVAATSPGLFELGLQPGDEYALATAPDRAALRIALVPGHATEGSALVVPLRRSAEALVECVDADGRPVEGAGVAACCLPRDVQWPREAPMSGSTPTWSARAGADGRLTLAGMPADTPLYLEVRPPAGSAPPPALTWTLQPGTNRERIVLAAAGTLRGRVADASGRALANAHVACMPAAGAPAMLPEIEPSFEATAGEDGAFELVDVPAGAWLVGLYRTSDWVARCVRVDLAAGGSAEVQLLVEAELAIGGRVLLPDGAPLGAIVVRAAQAGSVVASAVTGNDGAFRLAPLLAGDYELSTELYANDLALPAPLPVAAGAAPVELRVAHVCGSARGRVVAEPLRGGDLELQAWRRGGDEGRSTLCDADGGFVLEDMRAGTWDFVARDVHGRAALRAAVAIAPGRVTEDVELPLAAGALLRARCADADDGEVLAGGVVLARLPLPAGVPVELLLPPGPVAVRFLRRGLPIAQRETELRTDRAATVDVAQPDGTQPAGGQRSR